MLGTRTRCSSASRAASNPAAIAAVTLSTCISTRRSVQAPSGTLRREGGAMGRLDGRVAIVTGAGQGIGRGVARRFAREGAAVVVAEVNPGTGAQVAEEITEELGG